MNHSENTAPRLALASRAEAVDRRRPASLGKPIPAK
jgi:hypothetical protein